MTEKEKATLEDALDILKEIRHIWFNDKFIREYIYGRIDELLKENK